MKTEIIEKICGEACGVFDSPADNLKLFRFDKDMRRQPYLYGPSVIIMCKGSKTSYIKNRRIQFDKNSYLIVTGSIPLECEYIASRNDPIMGILVEIDLQVLYSVNSAIKRPVNDSHLITERELQIVSPTPRSEAIENVIDRILVYLQNEEKTALFINDSIKELFYYLLKCDQAKSLNALLVDGNFSRILSALEFIRKNFDQKITIEQLAKMSHMSETSFYRFFKKHTGDSPLQVIKKTRLSYAKTMLEKKQGSVKSVSTSVGYESPSHFSRDFFNLYGCLPGSMLRM